MKRSSVAFKRSVLMAFCIGLLSACGLAGQDQAMLDPPSPDLTAQSNLRRLQVVDGRGATTVRGLTDAVLMLAAIGAPDTPASVAFLAADLGSQTRSATTTYPALTPAEDPSGSNLARQRAWDEWRVRRQRQAASFLESGVGSRSAMSVQSVRRVGEAEDFWVYLPGSPTDTGKERVSATLVQSSAHAYVFVDNRDLEQVSKAAISQALGYWEDVIYPRDTATFGMPGGQGGDVDADTHVYILVSRDVGRNYGFFDPGDLAGLEQSNPHKMFYVAPWVVARQNPDVRGLSATLGHEFEHMINFYNKVVSPTAKGEKLAFSGEDLWLDEGLAVYAEQVCGLGPAAGESSSLAYVASFLERNPEAPLVTNDASRFEYGSGYLFAEYLTEQFGSDLPWKLVHSKKIGMANVETTTRRSFPAIFRRWGLSLYASSLWDDPEVTIKGFNLHGTYGGHRFSGIKVTTIDHLPAEESSERPSWSLLFARLRPPKATNIRLSVNSTHSDSLSATLLLLLASN